MSTPTPPSMRVLAIDPGYERLGIAVIDRNAEARGPETLVYSACFKTAAADPFEDRLAAVGSEVVRLIEEYQPAVFALEKLYWGSNQKTAMMVAEIRGMLIFLARSRGLLLREYAPAEVKIAVTGYGRSDKAQVTDMVRRLIRIDDRKRHDDEYDAIAIGITCLACLSGERLKKTKTA